MRFILVSYIPNSASTGMGKWSYAMAAELRGQGHSVRMWFSEDFPRLASVGRLLPLIFPLVLALRLVRERKSCDVVVIHEPSAFWYACLRRIFRQLPPMVLMSHTVESQLCDRLWSASRRGQSRFSRFNLIKNFLLRRWQSEGALRLADHVVCLSQMDYEYLTASLGLSPSRVTLKVNGVDSSVFSSMKRVVFSGRVLFLGGWLDSKGRRILPELWTHVLKTHPNARLTLLGTGQSAEIVRSDFLRSQWASLEIISRVDDEKTVASIMRNQDVFLMPSLTEGSPIALLEAMASGLPVVAAKVGGIPDIVTHGREGWLFDPANPIEGAEWVCRLLGSERDAHVLGEHGSERAAALTWKVSAEALLSASQKALSYTPTHQPCDIRGVN